MRWRREIGKKREGGKVTGIFSKPSSFTQPYTHHTAIFFIVSTRHFCPTLHRIELLHDAESMAAFAKSLNVSLGNIDSMYIPARCEL
jgi:hypothetical protein